eukprot:snap_masked-scaffold_23-processed-gene-0.40-mRNA-1 protein AED:1.00 eAED:1.00 QI:0/0/0/0/1/1/2/0/77
MITLDFHYFLIALVQVAQLEFLAEKTKNSRKFRIEKVTNPANLQMEVLYYPSSKIMSLFSTLLHQETLTFKIVYTLN